MIRFEGVTKSFGPVPALQDLSFDVRRGSFTALLGADGAGKSTVLKTILGLVRPDSGRVLFEGRPVAEALRDVRRAAGYMPELPGLYPDLTAEETLDFIAAIHGLPGAERRKRTAKLLDQAGLASFSGRRVGRLSGGMRQKLALCAALVPRPELLLLDEPTAGIDPLSRLDLFASLERLSGEGATILMTTASPGEAGRAESMVHLWRGRALRSAPVRGLEEESGRNLRDIILDAETAAEREDPA